jgi:hypothetical protein
VSRWEPFYQYPAAQRWPWWLKVVLPFIRAHRTYDGPYWIETKQVRGITVILRSGTQ